MKDPNFILGQTYASAMKVRESVGRHYETCGEILFLVKHKYQAIKVRENVGRRCEAYSETPKIRNPNKFTGFDKLKLEGCPLV